MPVIQHLNIFEQSMFLNYILYEMTLKDSVERLATAFQKIW